MRVSTALEPIALFHWNQLLCSVLNGAISAYSGFNTTSTICKQNKTNKSTDKKPTTFLVLLLVDFSKSLLMITRSNIPPENTSSALRTPFNTT